MGSTGSGQIPLRAADASYAAGVDSPADRYATDVLASGWRQAGKPVSTELAVSSEVSS